MKEERIFIELMKMPYGRVNIVVGGGSDNDGESKPYEDLSKAINDLVGRVTTDYVKMVKM